MRGSFITFEGVEGCGKSTHVSLLAGRLSGHGRSVIATREPGGTEIGSAIRKILLNPETGALDPVTELLLFSAARAELVAAVIKPALDKGSVVLCDRFADSTAAYQGYGRGMDLKTVSDMARLACGDVWPDRTIILDLDPEDGLKRAVTRMKKEGNAEARFEGESIKFHRRVREGFLKIAEAEPDRVKIVDASDAVEKVHEAVFEAVRDLFPDV